MAFTQVALAASFTTPGGDPARGRVRFTPSEAMANGGVVVVAAPVTVTLDAGGEISLSLPASDDAATLTLSGTQAHYLVEELLVGQRPRSYRVAIGYFDLTQNLTDIAVAGYPLPDGWGLMSATFTETF